MSTSAILRSIVRSPLVRGLLVGVAANEALDAVSIVMYEKESPFLRFRENGKRGFKLTSAPSVTPRADWAAP